MARSDELRAVAHHEASLIYAGYPDRPLTLSLPGHGHERAEHSDVEAVKAVIGYDPRVTLGDTDREWATIGLLRLTLRRWAIREVERAVRPVWVQCDSPPDAEVHGRVVVDARGHRLRFVDPDGWLDLTDTTVGTYSWRELHFPIRQAERNTTDV